MAPGFAAYREEGISIGAGAAIERPGGPEAGQRCPVGDGHRGFEHRVAFERARDAVRARPSRDDPHAAVQHVRRDPERARHVTDVPVQRHREHGVFVRIGRERECRSSSTARTSRARVPGTSRAEPSVDVIQEVHVQSIGASVEFGNIQGAVINVVTKQGGAQFQSQSGYYAQSSGLTAQPIVLPVTNGTQPSSGYERVRYRDFSTGLGGPVLRDRLWFYGAYQYLRDYDSQPGADPAFPRKYEQDKVFGKLTWRLTPSLQMMQSFHRRVLGESGSADGGHALRGNAAAARLGAELDVRKRDVRAHGSVTFGICGSGGSLYHQQDDPSTGDRTTPNRFDRVTGISSGNVREMGGLKLDRITAKAVFNRYQSEWLGANHELRAGIQLERGEHRAPTVIPGGVRYEDNNGAAVPGGLPRAVDRRRARGHGRPLRERCDRSQRPGHGQCGRSIRPQPRLESGCAGARRVGPGNRRNDRGAWARSTPGTSCLRGLV